MHLRCLSPPPQTACQNTERRHITAKARPGAAGKVLNVKINLSETSVKPGGEAYGWLSMAEESLNLILVLYSGTMAVFSSFSMTDIQCFAEDSKDACLADKPEKVVLAIV